MVLVIFRRKVPKHVHSWSPWRADTGFTEQIRHCTDETCNFYQRVPLRG